MKICIVGGGPAGLGMAYFLERAGHHDVVVFEKDDHVGGKCRTLRVDGRAYDMGAVEITKRYPITNDLVATFGCATETIPEAYFVDYTNGDAHPVLWLFHDVSKIDFAEQFVRYLAEEDKLQPYLDKPGMAGLPDSLRGVSFSAWLHRIRAPLMERVFWGPITCYGYGELDKIPAAYGLKFVSVTQFQWHALRLGLMGLLPPSLRLNNAFVERLTDGFQTLMERMAATFTRPPVLRATIDHVGRGPGGVVVRYRVGDDPAPRKETFDKIVVAIPQTLANLSFLDLTPTEDRLFRQVFVNRYYTSLTKPNTFDYKLCLELYDGQTQTFGPPPLPHVLMFARIWPQVPGSIFYTYAAPDDPRPLSGGPGSIEALVNDNIRALGQQPGADVESIAWDYFPQVSQAALDAGFYDDLEAIQGQNDTYYAGGLLSFELIEKALEYSRALVARFFP